MSLRPLRLLQSGIPFDARVTPRLSVPLDRAIDRMQVERASNESRRARRRLIDAREAVERRRESGGIERGAPCAMDPYNADPYRRP